LRATPDKKQDLAADILKYYSQANDQPNTGIIEILESITQSL
jgi:hypothetical protein